MRNRKRLRVHHAIVEANDVEIERSRAPFRRSVSARVRFDTVELIEQRVGIEGGLDGEHLIQIRRLLETTEWLGFVHSCCADDATIGNCRDGVAGVLEKAKPIAEV